ncbi:response regulator [Candidatus Parcubacteria bacterium]|jgi:CheY-like chemotaxis protein|nr:MAG: response regulator [Candidatus Parcubacteria bacterium]
MVLIGKKIPKRKIRPLILVVEDELSVASALRESLEEKDYSVAVAKDGIEAIEKARTLKPAAIILDLGLPKQNGLQVIERLRSTKADFTTPVIVLSQVESSVVLQKCEELGMACYFVKTHTSVQKVIDTVLKTVPVK